jgi:hypothetical protein
MAEELKVLLLILDAVIVILIADLVSGLVHWTEDTFWTEKTPVVGNWIVRPNLLHHRDGHAFTRNSWLQSSWDLVLAGALILLVAGLLNLDSWPVWLFVVIGANANQIHKWAHMPPAAVPAWVNLLQRLHLLQSASHHAAHHRGGKDSNYCVITEVMNPVLDRIGFWRVLERILVPLWGAPRRTDIRRAVE